MTFWRRVWMRIARLQYVDGWIVLAMTGLILLGCSAIYSVALSQTGGDFGLVKRQLIGLAIGLVVGLFFASGNYHLLRAYAKPVFLFGLLLLIAVLPFGETIRGTTGWFRFAGFQLQPVEPMKVALILGLAVFLGGRRHGDLKIKDIAKTALFVGVPVVATLMQPDFGSAAMLMAIWASLIWFAGLRFVHLLFFVLSGAAAGVVAWFFFLATYQKNRIFAFLEPTADPLGRGYNVAQAIIAIGSGGWFGRGLGFGSQSQLKFLPESQTDFILGVIGEELGFIGILLLVLCFSVILGRLAYHAFRAPDDFGGFLLIGVATIFFAQFTVNVGMNLGLLPVTGLGLPFVSYGGSSLIVMLSLAGLAQAVIVQSRLSVHRGVLADMRETHS